MEEEIKVKYECDNFVVNFTFIKIQVVREFLEDYFKDLRIPF